MSKQCYIPIRLKSKSIHLLTTAYVIIEKYERMNLRLTLRQLYYQLVSRNKIPNTEKSYKKLGKLLSNARLSGLIDWDSIEDRGRFATRPEQHTSIKSLIATALFTFRLPRLDGQKEYVEMWVEKDALSGVLQPLSNKYHVMLQPNKGYNSQSAMYNAARRIDRVCRDDKGAVEANATILYIGDHDPSGIDMDRDIQERMETFLGGCYPKDDGDVHRLESPCGFPIEFSGHSNVNIKVVRVGITWDQIQEYKPPPNPTKVTDSRSKEYIERYGDNSWEVDALPPEIIQELMTTEIKKRLDMSLVEKIKSKEEEQKAILRKAVKSIT